VQVRDLWQQHDITKSAQQAEELRNRVAALKKCVAQNEAHVKRARELEYLLQLRQQQLDECHRDLSSARQVPDIYIYISIYILYIYILYMYIYMMIVYIHKYNMYVYCM
jgi:hypothetical protein